MSRRNIALAAALSLLPLGQPLLKGSLATVMAVDVVFSAQAADAQSADDYLKRGNTKSDLKDCQGAIADYNKAIEINPQYANAYTKRGFAKHEIFLLRQNPSLESFLDIRNDLNKALEIDPVNAHAYTNLFNPVLPPTIVLPINSERRWERVECTIFNLTVCFYKRSDAINDKMSFLVRVIGKDQFHQDHDFELIFRCNPPGIVEYTHELHLGSHKFLLNPNRGRLLHDFCKRNF